MLSSKGSLPEELLSERSGVRIPFGTPKRTLPRIRKVCFLATFVFYEGFEGERAEHSEAKTSQCDVFSERAAETYNSAHAAASVAESVAESLCMYQYPFGTPKKHCLSRLEIGSAFLLLCLQCREINNPHNRHIKSQPNNTGSYTRFGRR